MNQWIAVLCLVGFLVPEFGRAEAPVILIYDGPGNCAEGCAEAAADAVERLGLEARYIQPDEMTDMSIFEDAVAWIQPGGQSLEMAIALGPERLNLIREFVKNGGSYLGLCAGAFLAGLYIDDPDTIPGLQIVPYSVYEYFPQATAILPVTMYDGSVRHVFFEEGPYFPEMDFGTVAIARYANGQSAAIATTFGYGRVILSGFHPEAPPEWVLEGLTDPDGEDYDILEEMLLWLIGEDQVGASGFSFLGYQ